MSELTASLEDYLEAIWVIGLDEKVVRVKDIARLLHVRAASVIGALKSLVEKDLAVHQRYGYVELTRKGKAVAREIYRRHELLTKFFHEVLGLNMDIAVEDACGIEHYIHKETADRLVQFMEFMETCPFKEKTGFSSFLDFIKEGTRPQARRKAVQK